jgi:hypothetical protein
MAEIGPEADCPVLAKILQKLPVRTRPTCGRLLGQARFPKVAAHNYMVRQPSRAVCPNPS